MTEWQTIKTAPKDVNILVHDPSEGTFVATHDVDMLWFPATSGENGPNLLPTHWMPLPEPPPQSA